TAKANPADDAGAAQGESASLSRDQTMADLFVELLTGQTTADGVTAEVVVVMDDTTLFGENELPAWIPGHGPLPSRMVKDWLADPAAEKFIRRMYTRPTDGQLVALESRRRRFPKGIANMLLLRDDTCATPGCNSPIEDADHRQPWAAGGPTSWANATGLCKRCNQRKENRGWRYTGTIDELTVITPTGHRYTVDTRPPLAEFKHWNSDPPHRHPGAIDIAWPTATIMWPFAA
ncbi:MAG TPA: HNH endonuclease signature motif containing protein, partial [Beutenbergiaceae bacterium]|nr:HNH endonuclease signature motif containing protein [Beutenbergiaceae bacterium]